MQRSTPITLQSPKRLPTIKRTNDLSELSNRVLRDARTRPEKSEKESRNERGGQKEPLLPVIHHRDNYMREREAVSRAQDVSDAWEVCGWRDTTSGFFRELAEERADGKRKNERG